MRATLESHSWLCRRLWVETPEGAFTVEYSGRGLGYESVWVDGTCVLALGGACWFVPVFDFFLGSLPASVEVRVWPWLTIRSFHLVVNGEVLYEEGRRAQNLRGRWSGGLIHRESRWYGQQILPPWTEAAAPGGHTHALPRLILLEAVTWNSDEPTREVFDLADRGQFIFLFMQFGAGNYIEARAVAESTEAAGAFRTLILLGGAEQASQPPKQSRLYRRGDEAYPSREPFIFICPTPDAQLVRSAVGPT